MIARHPWWVAGLGLLILSGLSLLVGAASLGGGDLEAGWLIAVSRLPRTAAALLAGAGLALSGVVIQLTVRNRMVEPGLTGTPEAAMLGLLAITILAPGAPIPLKMAAAALAAILGTGGFLALSRHVPRHDPMLLPLVGLIYGGILGACALWVAWTADLVQYLGIWLAGDFSGVVRGRYEMLWLIAGLSTALYFLADRITLLGLGEDHARSLGLDYRQTLMFGLGFVATAVAVVVVTVGSMPFVGLVVPNIVSRWRGDNLRANLPLIAAAGGGLVLASDIIGRLVRWPYEIPAATIFSIFGAGLFLWLLHVRTRLPAHG